MCDNQQLAIVFAFRFSLCALRFSLCAFRYEWNGIYSYKLRYLAVSKNMILLETFYEILQWYVYTPYRCRYIHVHMYLHIHVQSKNTSVLYRYKDTKYILINFYSVRIFTHTYITKKRMKEWREKRKALVEPKTSIYVYVFRDLLRRNWRLINTFFSIIDYAPHFSFY